MGLRWFDHVVLVVILFDLVPLSTGLSCYQCAGISGECQVEADPGKETLCPEIVDLIKNPLKIRFDVGWSQLPIEKSRNDKIGLLVQIFNESLPAELFHEKLYNESLTIFANTTDVEMLNAVNSIVSFLVEDHPPNVCFYYQKTARDGNKKYHRRCNYNQDLALSDWTWLEAKLKSQGKGEKENCGDGCLKKYCAEDLCNDKGIYSCMVCNGANNVCSDGEMGVSTACPSDQTYCIKELSGDTSNRKLSARYCGTRYDADQVCGSNGENIAIAAKGEVRCCSNREAQNCNGAESIKNHATFIISIILFISTLLTNA